MSTMGKYGQANMGQWANDCDFTQDERIPLNFEQKNPSRYVFWSIGKPIWVKWANVYDIAPLQVLTIL